MYLDIILLILSVVFFLISILIIFHLLKNKKLNKVYRSTYMREEEYSTNLTEAIKTLQGVETEYIGKSGTSNKGDISSVLENVFSESVGNREGTAFLFDTNKSSRFSKKTKKIDFDFTVIQDKYEVIEEIHGGGMSKVFLAVNKKLGNKWIIKFIPKVIGELTKEDDILKRLNHINLPKIVDIFRDRKGLYIVESYIEGVSLDAVIKSNVVFTQSVVLDWAEQIGQVLNYLHTIKPNPIYHFDIKPSNFIVTHDNRLVLIDFGVSKVSSDTNEHSGVTYKYCAPEQLNHKVSEKYTQLIKNRFGDVPADRIYWDIDNRVDIYSLGVVLFELLVGSIPTTSNYEELKKVASNDFCQIIYKCLNNAPDDRYETSGEFLQDLTTVKNVTTVYEKTLLTKKFGNIAIAFTSILFIGFLTSGIYLNMEERKTLLEIKPEIVVISEQQSSDFNVEKIMTDGEVSHFDIEKITWENFDDNVARIDGNRVSGINIGETEVRGTYRNKIIDLTIKVVEPLDGVVNISQRYERGRTASIYTGTTTRETRDGSIENAEFVSPESIDICDNGTIYVTDSGKIRKIKNGYVDTVQLEPEYLTANKVVCDGNDVYILTNEWEDNGSFYYGIVKLTNDGGEVLYFNDASYTKIEDIVIKDDTLYFIDRNSIFNDVYLKSVNLNNLEKVTTITQLSDGVVSLTIDENDTIFLADEQKGVIYTFGDDDLQYFAGVENEKAFIDGNAPLFYMPQNLKYDNGFLYIWDFNVVRRLEINDGVAGECITLVGIANPTFDLDIVDDTENAENIILPNSKMADFLAVDEKVLVTEPKRGVVWEVE